MRNELASLGRFAEPSLAILLALSGGPKHGYAIMAEARALTGEPLGPGTLYATLARLEGRGLIEGLPAEDRRRPYRLTAGRRGDAARPPGEPRRDRQRGSGSPRRVGRGSAAHLVDFCAMEPVPDEFRQVMGHFATGISVVTTFDGDRPAGITVNAFSSVSLEPALVMVALDRRRFITPMVRSLGRYAVNVLGADQQAPVRLLRPRPGQPGPRGLLRRGVACRADRAAAARRLDRHARVHGRRDVQRGRPRPVHRARRLARPAPRGRRAAALLPAPVPADRAGRRERGRRQAGGLSADAPGERARHRLRRRGRGSAARPPPRRDVARRGGLRRPAPEAHHGVPRPPARRARARPDALGRRPRASATTGWSTTWRRSSTVSGIDSFHLLGFSMGAMTALQFGARHPERLRTLVVVGITPLREPRASVGRRLMDPARILEREPEFAATLARRHDAGQGAGAWQRLLPAIAADIAAQPLLAPAELHRDRLPGDGRLRRPRPVRAAGARGRPRPAAARRAPVRRARTAATRSWLAGRACSTRR